MHIKWISFIFSLLTVYDLRTSDARYHTAWRSFLRLEILQEFQKNLKLLGQSFMVQNNYVYDMQEERRRLLVINKMECERQKQIILNFYLIWYQTRVEKIGLVAQKDWFSTVQKLSMVDEKSFEKRRTRQWR